jgi:hypothetical protein
MFVCIIVTIASPRQAVGEIGWSFQGLFLFGSPFPMLKACSLCVVAVLPSVLFVPVVGADDSQSVVTKALAAVGGSERLLWQFRMKETFHFGETPEPAAGKSRSTRDSILSVPMQKWWVNKSERGDEPAKFVVAAWSLGLVVDEKSRLETVGKIMDDEVECAGVKVSGSVDPPLTMYFREDNALLKRVDWRGDIYRFSNWKEQAGAKYAATTVIYKDNNGKPWFYHDVTDLERLEKLPEGLKD